jgi:putative membrane protein
MAGNPYERFRNGEHKQGGELAIDRTVLANERTLLAYVRTALAFAVTGVGAIKFLTPPVSLLVGWSLVTLAAGVVAFGVWRFSTTASHISTSRQPPPGSAHPRTGR